MSLPEPNYDTPPGNPALQAGMDVFALPADIILAEPARLGRPRRGKKIVRNPADMEVKYITPVEKPRRFALKGDEFKEVTASISDVDTFVDLWLVDQVLGK